MVQGLAFLSKKSWHVKNKANQEKVWLAEQRQQAEKEKTKQLAEQIKLEREEEELDAMRGSNRNRKDRGIAWMYQEGGEAAMEDKRKQAEEYLLGKEFVPDVKKTADEDQKQGINAVVSATESILPTKKVDPSQEEEIIDPSKRNEAFRLQHEDPMFFVQQERKTRDDRASQNDALRARVTGQEVVRVNTSIMGPKKEKKKRRKKDDSDSEDSRRRRKKKHKKSRKRSYSSDEDSEERARRRRRKAERRRERDVSSDDSRRPRRKRYHSDGSDSRQSRRHRESRNRDDKSRDRGDERRQSRRPGSDSEDSYRRSRYSRHEDYDRESGRRRDRSRRNYDNDDSYRRREESPRYDQSHYERRHNIDGGRYGAKSPSEDSFGRRRRPESADRDVKERTGSPTRVSEPRKYGLQGSTNRHISKDDLGPDRSLLEKKRQEKERERQERMSLGRSQPMSAQERAAALRDMQTHAALRYDGRIEAKREEDITGKNAGNATFLKDIRQERFGL